MTAGVRRFGEPEAVIPMFTTGTDEVARLTELAADDTAARTAGRRDLVAALLAIATGTAVTGASMPGMAPIARGALAAAAQDVPARVERLIHPPGPADTARAGLVLALAAAAFVVLPAALAALAG